METLKLGNDLRSVADVVHRVVRFEAMVSPLIWPAGYKFFCWNRAERPLSLSMMLFFKEIFSTTSFTWHGQEEELVAFAVDYDHLTLLQGLLFFDMPLAGLPLEAMPEKFKRYIEFTRLADATSLGRKFTANAYYLERARQAIYQQPDDVNLLLAMAKELYCFPEVYQVDKTEVLGPVQ